MTSRVIADGVTLGAIYALVATGFSLIYRATGLFNIAQGVLLALPPYLLHSLMTDHGWSFWPAAAGAIALTAVLGATIHLLLLRRLLGFELWSAVMVTVGLLIVAEGFVQIVWGGSFVQLETPWELERVVILGLETTNVAVVTVLTAILAISLLAVVFHRTTFGSRLRAAGTQPRLATLCGVNINLMFAATWAIAGVLAAVAGIEYASASLVGPSIFGLGLRAFPAALVGGLDSLPGSAVGGLIVGLAESWVVHEFEAQAADAAVFVVLLIALTIRPNGIFGRAQAARV